jgi:hypothetical protein
MATELVACVSQFRLISLYAQRSEQFRASIAGYVFQLTAQNRGVFVLCKISDWHPRRNHTKAPIECGKLAQKRLQGRIAYPSFLWTRRILERLQAVRNKQGSTMRHELRQSFALLPLCSDPWIWIVLSTK